MHDHGATQDPAAIEQDIRRTQEEMSRTADRIGSQLTPRNLINALLDQAESNNVDARKLLDGARRNPLALGMIAGGALWLISDYDAKFPHRSASDSGPDLSDDYHHRDYVTHMERIDLRDGEDPLTYQRRRDIARANYLMVERDHDEDDASFRRRLNEAGERFRAKRRAWSDHAQESGRALKDRGSAAASQLSSSYGDSPLVGGLIAAAAGAFLGSILPTTAMEEEKLAGLGESLRDAAADQKDHLVERFEDKLSSNPPFTDQAHRSPAGMMR